MWPTCTLLQAAHCGLQAADLVVVAGGQDRGRVPRCIEHAGEAGVLVCDGRLVVDAAFRTNDPKIFAAGTVATFSRRFARSLFFPMMPVHASYHAKPPW